MKCQEAMHLKWHPNSTLKNKLFIFIIESNQVPSLYFYMLSGYLENIRMYSKMEKFKEKVNFVWGHTKFHKINFTHFHKIQEANTINRRNIWTRKLTLNSTLVFGNGSRRQAGLTTQFFSAWLSLYCLFFWFILTWPLLDELCALPMSPTSNGFGTYATQKI